MNTYTQNNIEIVDYEMELATLKWLLDAGANEAIGDEALDRLNIPVIPTGDNMVSNPVDVKTNLVTDSKPVSVALGTVDSVAMAEKAVKSIDSVKAFIQALTTFSGCPSLQNGMNNTISYAGSYQPKILCIGNHPNKQDDKNGIPFAEEQGLLLQKIFTALHIDYETQVGRVNCVFWYPPGGRSISNQEYSVCNPFVNKIIELADPDIIITLGIEASKNILGREKNARELFGIRHTVNIQDTQRVVLPLYHPEYILNTPKSKKNVWRDLQILKNDISIIVTH